MSHLLPYFAFLLFLSLSVQPGNARDIKMVTTDWPPFYSQSLPNGGPLTEIVTEALHRSGHTSSVKYLPWNRARRQVLMGESDLILGAYFSTERAKKHAFSTPIMMVDVGLVAHKKLKFTSFKKLHDLTPYSIGVSKGWVNNAAFDSADYLQKDVAQNQILNIRKLAYNRVDMIVISFEVFRYEDAKVHRKENHSPHVFIKPLLSRSPLYLMINKEIPDHQLILKQFNSSFKEMQRDGSYQRILAKHKMGKRAAVSP